MPRKVGDRCGMENLESPRPGLILADLAGFVELDRCINRAGSPVSGTGVDFAPDSELISVRLHFVQVDSMEAQLAKLLRRTLEPFVIRTAHVWANLLKSKVGGFILKPKRAVEFHPRIVQEQNRSAQV